MTLRAWFVLFICLASISGAAAAELEVSDAWIRLLPAGAPAGGYFTVRNLSRQAATLTGASSTAFGHVMMHRTEQAQGRSRMLPVEKVEIPAGGKLAFAPGGYHLMLMQPSGNIAVGDRVVIALEFAGGQKVSARFEVLGPAGK